MNTTTTTPAPGRATSGQLGIGRRIVLTARRRSS